MINKHSFMHKSKFYRPSVILVSSFREFWIPSDFWETERIFAIIRSTHTHPNAFFGDKIGFFMIKFTERKHWMGVVFHYRHNIHLIDTIRRKLTRILETNEESIINGSSFFYFRNQKIAFFSLFLLIVHQRQIKWTICSHCVYFSFVDLGLVRTIYEMHLTSNFRFFFLIFK